MNHLAFSGGVLETRQWLGGISRQASKYKLAEQPI